MKRKQQLLIIFLLLIVFLTGCGNLWSDMLDASPTEQQEALPEAPESGQTSEINEDGFYTSRDEVALYIHTFGKLPSNYVTKKEAQEAGWDSHDNTLDNVLPGMSIGGDHFGNHEGLLPEKNGRSYKECDIDYVEGYRNAKRIIYSNDGLIYYTDDHYKTFEQLY